MRGARTHEGPGVEAIVVETNPDGHRLAYVGILAREFGPAQWTLVSCPGVETTPEYVQHVAGHAPRGLIATTEKASKVLKTAIRQAKASGTTKVIVTDSDRYIPALLATPSLWLGRMPRVRCLLMRTPVGGRGMRATFRVVAKTLLVLLAARMPGVDVYFLTDCFGAVRRRRFYPGIRPVPDPVQQQPPQAPRSEVGPGAVARWNSGLTAVGVVGTVAARKNVELLVDAAHLEGSTVIVLVGRLDEHLKRVRQTSRTWAAMVRQGRLFIDDRYIPEAEFDTLIRSLTAVAVLHDNDSPSGILGEAAARGIPAIVPDSGWLAEVARATGAAITTRLTRVDVAAALAQLREDSVQLGFRAEEAGARLGVHGFVRALVG